MPPEPLSVTLPTLEEMTAMMGRQQAPGLHWPFGLGFARRGSNAWMTRRGPTALMRKRSSISCCLTSDQSWSGSSSALCSTPALWITCVMPDRTLPLTAFAASWTEATSPTSHWTSVTCLLAAFLSCSVGSFRYVAITWLPLAAICFTSSSPIPRDAPMMTTSESLVRGEMGFCSSAIILRPSDGEHPDPNPRREPAGCEAGRLDAATRWGERAGAARRGQAANECTAGTTPRTRRQSAAHDRAIGCLEGFWDPRTQLFEWPAMHLPRHGDGVERGPSSGWRAASPRGVR
mmetsp:Transcript_33120/g.83574  ORF Transcript_33120/g.83574 Transcript_33120/m.83574 type:complete len:290 (+) Transcript_33120:347-1216(+)